jgi:hypothetical protein
MDKILTPRQFLNKIKKIIKHSDGDYEDMHPSTDEAMEDLLISLGYQSGVKLIQDTERWYA